ncbi:hypothetical protein BH11CYA1_BH11CYA1_00490 [soil metagenome]
MIGFYHICPANSALLISSSNQINNKAIKRITKKSTWINPFNEHAQVVDLSAITFNYVFHVPIKPSGEFLLQCEIITKVDSLDENIRLAATKGYGSDQKSDTAKLVALLKRIKVTEEHLSESLENFCNNKTAREQSKLSEAIKKLLQMDGLLLLSFSPTKVVSSDSKAAVTLSSEQSHYSQSLRKLSFEQYVGETKIVVPRACLKTTS